MCHQINKEKHQWFQLNLPVFLLIDGQEKHSNYTKILSSSDGLATQQGQDKAAHLPSQLPQSEGRELQTLSPPSMLDVQPLKKTHLQFYRDQDHYNNRVLSNSCGKAELVFCSQEQKQHSCAQTVFSGLYADQKICGARHNSFFILTCVDDKSYFASSDRIESMPETIYIVRFLGGSDSFHWSYNTVNNPRTLSRISPNSPSSVFESWSPGWIETIQLEWS